MNYREALAWLFGTQQFGIKLGLENIERLLAQLSLPAEAQRIIHVAGTNGKGSVCAMLDAICRAQNLRTGLFTSPHLITFRERIRVDGEMISEHDVAKGLGVIRELIQDWQPHPTFFEIATALGLSHFKQEQCSAVILETGMGGRLDATNAVTPVVSVLTPIDYDHQTWLGNRLEEIAAEKAGIIKPTVPVVSSPQKPAVMEVIRERARECEAALQFVAEPYSASAVALVGGHQRENAATAIASLCAAGFPVEDTSIREGLARVSWPARFQRWNRRTIIDGAHNPAGVSVLVKTWIETFGDERAVILLSVLRDKDAPAIWRPLSRIAKRVILPRIRSNRAMPTEDLARVIRSSGDIETQIAPTVTVALEAARKDAAPILITGSLHFAGEALAVLRGEDDEFEECAQ